MEVEALQTVSTLKNKDRETHSVDWTDSELELINYRTIQSKKILGFISGYSAVTNYRSPFFDSCYNNKVGFSRTGFVYPKKNWPEWKTVYDV